MEKARPVGWSPGGQFLDVITVDRGRGPRLNDYAAATSMISRLLYFPQNGQARCGRMRSWQDGHSARPLALMESCARRWEVRRFEWRRLGFGMVSLFLVYYDFYFFRLRIASVQRLSTGFGWQSHAATFRF